MMHFARSALIAVGLLSISTATAAAQALPGIYHYRVVVTDSAGNVPVTVGVDDGNGFSFATLADDDGDGLIELPRVPVPGRLALRVTPDVSPDVGSIGMADLHWSIEEASAESLNFPLLTLAEGVEGDLGIDFGELMAPPLVLTPGQQITVAGGVLPQWPGVSFLDTSGVPDLETFVQVVDTLPGFTGQVVVSNTMVHFTLVPEPSTLLVSLFASAVLLSCRRRGCVLKLPPTQEFVP